MTSTSDVCNAVHEASGARCFQETADHSVRHHAWAHYPGQLVTWPVEEDKGTTRYVHLHTDRCYEQGCLTRSGESEEPESTPIHLHKWALRRDDLWECVVYGCGVVVRGVSRD